MLNIVFDNKGYNAKPTTQQMGVITNNIKLRPNTSLNVKDLAQVIGQGKTYLLGHINEQQQGLKANNIININAFSIDIDNKYEDNKNTYYTSYTIEEVIKKVQALIGASPSLSYSTFTGINKENNSERFRLIYEIEDNINLQQFNNLMLYLMEHLPYGMIDKACKNPNRLFLGTNKPNSVVLYDKRVKLSMPMIKLITSQMIAIQEQQEKEKLLRLELNKEYKANIDNSIDDVLNIDIIDVFNNLATDTRINVKGTDYIQYKICPICGHKDDFSINTNKNMFMCFHNMQGGNVINLYATIKNISYGQAIKELQDLYNIKPSKALEPSNALTIDKYISGDKKALETILEAIKDNRKVALYSSMGTGKTYFTVNNLYEYSKSINKTLIIVIPNVAQLENMKNKYKVPIVCGNYKYRGSDIVAVTPESLPKVTEQLKQDEYILVCDEAHENITSYGYRNGYKADNVGLAEVGAFKIIHMTATPRTLIYNKYNKVITVNSKAKITNKINILPIEKSADSINQAIKHFTEQGKQVLFFNNNIEKNNTYANILNGFDSAICDDDFMIDEEYIKVLAATLKSGDNNTQIIDSIKQGVIPNDYKVVLFTSTIKAGIDLKAEHKAPILLINAIDNTNIDDIIQLIGRFREGIEVFILTKHLKASTEEMESQNVLVKDLDFNKVYNSLLDLALYNLKYVIENKATYDIYQEGFIKDYFIELEGEGFKINKQALTYKAYKTFCKSLNKDYRLLINELQGQQAFNIDGDVNIYDIVIKTNDTTVKEVLKASKEEKEAIKEECINTLLNADIDEIKAIYEPLKMISDLGNEVLEAYNTLKTLDKKLTVNVKEVTETLSVDNAEGLVKVLKTPKKELKKELEQVQTIKVNRAIKEVGVDTYLKNKKAKTSIEMLQSRIIKELKPTIKKQGRLTNKLVKDLTIKLIREGYFRDTNAKKFLDESFSNKDREIFLNKVIEKIGLKLNMMFNFSDDRISSIKYK